MPAGTHRLAVCYEAAKRMLKSPLARYCPGANELASLAPARAAVLNARAKHHVGASYLTGLPRAQYNDTDFSNFIGRLGTFIREMAPRSTLAQSPHLTVSSIESSEDYDATWKNVLLQYKLQAMQQTQTALTGIQAEASLSQEQLVAMRHNF